MSSRLPRGRTRHGRLLSKGIPDRVPSYTVNKVWSALKAVGLAAQAILAGDGPHVCGWRHENMSMAPYVHPGARWGARMGHSELVDVMIKDGLWCAFNDVHMGITAENIAERWQISREEQDEFAAASQQKCEAAQAEDRFADEIVPVIIPQRKGDPIRFARDEYPRAGVTAEGLAKPSVQPSKRMVR